MAEELKKALLNQQPQIDPGTQYLLDQIRGKDVHIAMLMNANGELGKANQMLSAEVAKNEAAKKKNSKAPAEPAQAEGEAEAAPAVN